MDLSIIIPVYNCTSYLLKGFEALKPLYSSTISFEIIYVNDGSTDNSLQILQQLEANNQYVKIVNQENKGAAAARNLGVKNSLGDYLLFLDADDALNIEAIIEFLYFSKFNDLDLCSFRIELFDAKLNSIGVRALHPIPYEKIITGREALIQGFQPSSACVFIYEKSFLIDNKLCFQEGITQEDVEFTARILMYAQKVYFSLKVGYYYFKHSGSVSEPNTQKNIEKYMIDAIQVANLIKLNEKNEMLMNSKALYIANEKNYNSVVWNLLWRFFSNPNEVSLAFKIKCIEELKNKKLYPIKGALKTNFQRFTRVFLNQKFLLTALFKIRN